MNRETLEAQLWRSMGPCLLITDIGFIIYWVISLAALLGMPLLPPEYLFKDYDQPIMMVWNWSFFPLDMILSICGLWGMSRYRNGKGSWRPLIGFSLALTFCAGFMALCFWAIRGDFDLGWWLANGFLCIWPLYHLPKLARLPSSE